MKNCPAFAVFKKIILLFMPLFALVSSAQATTAKSDFWNHVQFGGGIGVSVGSGYTDVTIAPGGIYNFNPYFSAGLGIQGTYVRDKGFYEAYIYGGSVIGLFNPIEQVQFSLEVEEVRVNRNGTGIANSDDFWNTGLFVGAGYRAENVTIGARYNVLHDKNDFVYSDAFMPFIRVYF